MSPHARPPFGRVLTAMVTPFDADGAVDTAAAARIATHLVDNDHDGLVIFGTTGESPTVSAPEQEAVLRAVVEAVGTRASVVAGVGSYDTSHALSLARTAEASGADGLLAVTPYYSKPPQEGILAQFKAIADASGLPVMLYDIPGRTGTKLAADTLARAAEHPRIVAVKEASGDLFAGSWLLRSTDLVLYSGDDALNLAWLAVGAVGVVSVVGHVAGPQYAAMVAAVDSGDLQRAREVDRALLPVVDAIMNRTQGAIMAKAALELQGHLDNRVVRLPLVQASDAQVEELRRDLTAAGMLGATDGAAPGPRAADADHTARPSQSLQKGTV
ncbi:MAG: 4-hydroxy-tetrahydrodipicolinate synthase [Nocardioidaceae bacterium]|nr:4-hydroxy-tetrahydrodipicolinate synthase [Nocardioidaceae bacterium]